jgi:hypothetical protein
MSKPIKTNRIDPNTRARIQTTAILNRLEAYALAVLQAKKLAATARGDAPKGPPVYEVDHKIRMTEGQVRAAKILLDKTLPNLSQVDIPVAVPDAEHGAPPRPKSFAEFTKRAQAMGNVISLGGKS